MKNSDLNIKPKTLAAKAKSKAEQDKIVKMQTYDLSYFRGKKCFWGDGFQNMFVYQATPNTLELKEDKGTYYIFSWKSKGVYTCKFKPLNTALLHSIKRSEYRMEIIFDKDPLSLEENSYVAKIANSYIAYELDAWPKNPLNNFKFKNCLFVATNTIKSNDKERWVYSGYGIAFDGVGSWNFGNDFAGNFVIFGVDNSSSSHDDNRKNNFLVLGEGPTYGINGTSGSPEKKFSINFSRANTKFCLSLHYNGNNSYLFC